MLPLVKTRSAGGGTATDGSKPRPNTSRVRSEAIIFMGSPYKFAASQKANDFISQRMRKRPANTVPISSNTKIAYTRFIRDGELNRISATYQYELSPWPFQRMARSEEHTSELQSPY